MLTIGSQTGLCRGSIVVVDEAAPRREELGDVHLDGASILRHEPSALPEAYMADMGLQTSESQP